MKCLQEKMAHVCNAFRKCIKDVQFITLLKFMKEGGYKNAIHASKLKGGLVLLVDFVYTVNTYQEN